MSGWAVPTATDIAFALGVLALLGERVPPSLRVFVAAFAVVDDIVSVLILAIFYPHNFQAEWLIAAAAAIAMMFALNRWRVYATWPYAAIAVGIWFFLHSAGVHGALAGIVLAAFLPTRPAPPPDRCWRKPRLLWPRSNMRKVKRTRERTIPYWNGPAETSRPPANGCSRQPIASNARSLLGAPI